MTINTSLYRAQSQPNLSSDKASYGQGKQYSFISHLKHIFNACTFHCLAKKFSFNTEYKKEGKSCFATDILPERSERDTTINQIPIIKRPTDKKLTFKIPTTYVQNSNMPKFNEHTFVLPASKAIIPASKDSIKYFHNKNTFSEIDQQVESYLKGLNPAELSPENRKLVECYLKNIGKITVVLEQNLELLKDEGPYRKSAVKDKLVLLEKVLEHGITLDSDLIRENYISGTDLTGLLKHLANKTIQLLPSESAKYEAYYQRFNSAKELLAVFEKTSQSNFDADSIKQTQSVFIPSLEELPLTHRLLMPSFFAVLEQSTTNKMNPSNLATCISPTLFGKGANLAPLRGNSYVVEAPEEIIKNQLQTKYTEFLIELAYQKYHSTHS